MVCSRPYCVQGYVCYSAATLWCSRVRSLQCGNIVVFTGMLLMCDNDDQLGCVLGHEMAHTVLGHTVRHACKTTKELVKVAKHACKTTKERVWAVSHPCRTIRDVYRW